MNSNQYTDPLGKFNQTLSSLYDFIPALRRQRVRGILEPPVAAATQPDPNRFNPPESGGQGSWGGSENAGWGELGTPSNTELGIPTTIGPAQALGNVFGLVSNPIGLPMSLAMQQMGLKPSNLFSPDYQMMPAPVVDKPTNFNIPFTTQFATNWSPADAMALANELGVSLAGIDSAGSGGGIGGEGFGGAGPGAVGGGYGDPDGIGGFGDDSDGMGGFV